MGANTLMLNLPKDEDIIGAHSLMLSLSKHGSQTGRS